MQIKEDCAALLNLPYINIKKSIATDRKERLKRKERKKE